MPSIHDEQAKFPVPLGRKSPRGRTRWYLAHAPRGKELSTATKLTQLVSKECLGDAFIISRERWMRHSGIWTLETEPMYREYLFVESCDAISLNDAISKLSFNIELVGASSSSITPIDDDIRKWLTYAMDESHTIRASIASIANGTLHVCSGPLVGQESRIIKIDRHKRSCSVLISDHNGGFAERFALNVPVKS